MGVMLLTIVLNPDAVRRAQKEIDAVVGNDRLPDFGDREKLPYIEAFVEEAARWDLHLLSHQLSSNPPFCA